MSSTCTAQKRARVVAAIAEMERVSLAVADDILTRHQKFAMKHAHERIAEIAARVLDEESHRKLSAYVETDFTRRHIAAERARGNVSGVSQEARIAIEKALGEMGSLLDATRLLKPAGLKLIGEPAIRFFQRARAWSVDLHSVSDAPKLFASLVSKRALTASDPYLHDMPLYVPTKDGFVVVAPTEKAPRASNTPSKSDEKDALVRRVEAFFGHNSARILGHDGDYKLSLKPLGRFRGVFGNASFSAPTLSELGVKMDAAIAKARAAVGDGDAS